MPIRVVVWGENVHEQTNAVVRGIYPDGMHSTIAAALNEDRASPPQPPRCRNPSTG